MPPACHALASTYRRASDPCSQAAFELSASAASVGSATIMSSIAKLIEAWLVEAQFRLDERREEVGFP